MLGDKTENHVSSDGINKRRCVSIFVVKFAILGCI